MIQTNQSLEIMRIESAFKLGSIVAQAEAKGVSVINLGLGQPACPTPEHVSEAAIKAIRDGHHGYSPPLGLPALRETVSSYFEQRYGVKVSSERIAITPGGKPIMNFAITMLARTGSEIIYPDPGFPIYSSMIDYMGVKSIPLPLTAENAFTYQIEDVRARINQNTSLLIINSPHNPTGGVTPESFFRELEILLQDYPNCVVMSDEIYSHFTFGETKHFSMLQLESLRDRLIILDGFSKSFAMTGWRLGFSYWPEEMIDNVFKLAVNSYSCPNTPTQYAGIAALTGDMKPVEKMCRDFARRAKIMATGLNDIKGITTNCPEGAFYIFPNVAGTGFTSEALTEKLLFEAGVGGIAGDGFGEQGINHMRFSCVVDDDVLIEALKRMKNYLG